MADTYRFVFLDAGMGGYHSESYKNGTQIDYDKQSFPTGITSSNGVYTYSGSFGSGWTIFGANHLNTTMTAFSLDTNTGVATMTLADGRTLSGTGTRSTVSGGPTFDLSLTIDSSGGDNSTYGFTFNYESTNFSSTKNGSTVDQCVMGLSLPYLTSGGSGYTWTGTFGSGTAIFGSTHLNSNLVSISLNISTNAATMTLADGTVLEGTGSYDGEFGNFANMVITSGGGGGGSATQLDTPVASASCTASGVLTITGLNDANADGYKVKYWNTTQTESNATTATPTVSSGSATINLTTGYSYTIKVQAVGDGTTYSDSEWSSSIGPTAVGVQLSYPSSLTFASVTSSGFYASWATVTGATGYKLQYKITSDNQWTEVSTSTNNFYTLTGLIYGTTYDVQVKALGSGTSYTDSDWSGTSRQTTTAAATQLDRPSTPTVVQTAPMTIQIGGLTDSNAIGYKVRYNKTGTGMDVYITSDTLTPVDGVVTLAVRTDSPYGAGEYMFGVQAIGDGSNYTDSQWSPLSEGINLAPSSQLTTPSGFTALYSYTSGYVHTVSGLNVANAVGYKIRVNHITGTNSVSGVLTAVDGTITYTDSVGLADGEDTVQVQAIGDGINYTDSEWSTAVQPIVPSQLTKPTITATGGDGQIVVSGLNVANATSYDIGYKVDGASEWTTLASVVPSAGSYTITGLSTPEDYYVRAKAKSSSASYTDSDWSTEVSASTDYVQTTLSAPTITATTNDRHSIVVSGLNIANSTGYVISYSVHGDDNWITTNTVQAVGGLYTLSGLDVETVYDVKAKAIGDGGRYLDSPFSLVVTGETAAMAGSTGGIFRPIETTSTMLSDIEVESGQFIICTDTRKLYYDTSTNTRIELQ